MCLPNESGQIDGERERDGERDRQRERERERENASCLGLTRFLHYF